MVSGESSFIFKNCKYFWVTNRIVIFYKNHFLLYKHLEKIKTSGVTLGTVRFNSVA